ncbi:AAA family ATPase [Raineyella sp. W15-4]|uniref:AAA family ATPase n=1 Tax=Raineyella sp. W15-4 TaxID=3081651 RepID=UPI0029557A58|nr:AAA family ATPase [Raineyella sp. W15-4]WOQ16224.1 AAA family ATPase [Raineyella sp. W15-4]
MARQKRLTHLSLENYRSVRSLDLELSPLTAFIGPNGSGKSNVLSAIRFLSTTASKDLESAIAQFGGFHRVHREAAGTGRLDPVRIGVAGIVTAHASYNAPDEYDLAFSQKKSGRITRDEAFVFKRAPGQGRRRRIHVTGAEITTGDEDGKASASDSRDVQFALASELTTGLFAAQAVQVARDDNRGIVEFAEFLKSLIVFEPQVREIVEPVRSAGGRDDRPPVRLAADGANLAPVLEQLRMQAPESYGALVSDMKECLPGLEDIVLDMRGGATDYTVVQIVERGARQPFDLADASYGTVRMLALLTALHQLNPPAVMAIEEVDSGLHPYALDVLVERLRTATGRTQLLVSSHSPTFVNRLDPEEIVVCDRDPESGESVIPAVGSGDIRRAVEAAGGMGAGELWFAGVLDGVPRGA